MAHSRDRVLAPCRAPAQKVSRASAGWRSSRNGVAWWKGWSGRVEKTLSQGTARGTWAERKERGVRSSPRCILAPPVLGSPQGKVQGRRSVALLRESTREFYRERETLWEVAAAMSRLADQGGCEGAWGDEVARVGYLELRHWGQVKERYHAQQWEQVKGKCHARQ